MRGHIVRSFGGVAETCRFFGDKAFEEVAQVERYIGVCIFLDDQRAGSVLKECGQQAPGQVLLREPVLGIARKGIEAFAARRDG